MSEILIKTLKKLNGLGPDHDFPKRSLPLILNAPQNKQVYFRGLFAAFQFGGALVLASVLIFIILGGADKLNFNSPARQLTSLDTENLKAELNDLDLKIKLAEIKYSENPAEISLALSETEAESQAVENLLKELTL